MDPVAEAFVEEVSNYAGRTLCENITDDSKAF